MRHASRWRQRARAGIDNRCVAVVMGQRRSGNRDHRGDGNNNESSRHAIEARRRHEHAEAKEGAERQPSRAKLAMELGLAGQFLDFNLSRSFSRDRRRPPAW